MQGETMAVSATSPQLDGFKSTVEVTLKILHFLGNIIQFLFCHVVKIICSICEHLMTDESNFRACDDCNVLGESARMVQGKFKCPECGNRWSSGQSWANTGQKCKKCLTIVYPHDQRPLQPITERNYAAEKKPHLPELCEKCKTLGYNCRRARNSGLRRCRNHLI